MSNPTPVRRALADDLPAMKAALRSSELFPPEYLEGLMADYLHNPHTDQQWFVALSGQVVAGFAYCAPESFTSGTYNLYTIAVDAAQQGKGLGTTLMRHIEQTLGSAGVRLLIVDTSGADQFSKTRLFYEGLGYTREACIRDFWNEGEDKIVYWKRLTDLSATLD